MRAVKDLVAGLTPEEREVLEKFIALPNSPDIQPEILRLAMRYGDRLEHVTKRVENTRQQLGMSYDMIQKAIRLELAVTAAR